DRVLDEKVRGGGGGVDDASKRVSKKEGSANEPANALKRASVVFCRVRLQPAPHLEDISPAVRRLTGYSRDEFIADPELIRRVVHPEDRRRLETLLTDPARAAGQTGFRLVHRDGR